MNELESIQGSDENLSSYARMILKTFESPVASGAKMDAMLYMTVGSERIQLVHKVTKRYRTLLDMGRENRTPRVVMDAVLGHFGTGKSHMGFLLKHDGLTCGQEELLVSHHQISGDSHFSSIIAGWLRNLRLAGVPSIVDNGVDLSAYMKLVKWCGNDSNLRNVIIGNSGKLEPALVQDLHIALRMLGQRTPISSGIFQFIENWVVKSPPEQAREVFKTILSIFCFLKCERLLLFLDEFEQLRIHPQPEQLQALLNIQGLHDEIFINGQVFPSIYLLILSTPDWWQTVSEICPSFTQRLARVNSLPQIEQIDVTALLYRYLSLYQLAYDNMKFIRTQDFNRIAEDAWHEVAPVAGQIRIIHKVCRQKIEDALGIA